MVNIEYSLDRIADTGKPANGLSLQSAGELIRREVCRKFWMMNLHTGNHGPIQFILQGIQDCLYFRSFRHYFASSQVLPVWIPAFSGTFRSMA